MEGLTIPDFDSTAQVSVGEAASFGFSWSSDVPFIFRGRRMYEVELKFPLSDPDPVRARLVEMGAEPRATFDQRDRYFAHPTRDFARSDEALRIRTMGDENRVTYKGPVVDARTKTRREIELALAAGAETGESMREMLELLGFREVRTVAKQRTPWSLDCDGHRLEIVQDDVEGLGLFLEIETMANEHDRAEAQDVILRFAERLGLANPERRSYLEMLLSRDASS